jgi:hypothetical protein
MRSTIKPTAADTRQTSGHACASRPKGNGGIGMIDRLVEGPALIVLVVFAISALVAGVVTGLIKGDGTWSRRGPEAMLTAFVGGLLARSFVSVLLSAGNDSPEVGWSIGWALFLWPGAAETVARLFGGHLLSSAALLWVAAGVGAFTGMMAGIWMIHPWRRTGALQLLLDTTWGLAGATNACLLHLFNFAWARHGAETRTGAHRYEKGFRIKHDFAFTQGPVMSELDVPPGKPLYRHEMVHVWQNRAFGPLFVMTYVAWMAVMLFPAVIVSIRKGRPFDRLQGYCYFSNPWEAWGYKVQEKHGGGLRTDHAYPMWSDQVVVAVGVIFYAAVAGFLSVAAVKIWT